MNNTFEPTQRQLRVGEQVRQIISNCLIKNVIPSLSLIDTSVTVSMVKMSKDLKIAYVYVMPLGGVNIEEINKALNENRIFFQKELAKKIRTKFTPKIFFYADDSFLEAEKINNLLSLEKVKKDLN
tara:strand:+ start:84 stop:461 length:378 start_codon:yes stop_codon:yes gene_type:complete